jgi:hypothetical protein
MTVPETHWEGSDGDFTLNWAGRHWTLKFDETDPGLRCDVGPWSSRLLSLHGLAAVGRFDDRVFTAATLVGVEKYRSRVQATFAPRGWGELTVRAAWSPSCGGAGVDLEVQASASSVGLLRDVEVIVQSLWERRDGLETSTDLGRHVEPRDARSAALSYDGRETAGNLASLVTLAVTNSPRPHIFTPSGAEDGISYIEMVQPNDASRRIRLEASAPRLTYLDSQTIQYGFFGHDFEKGVVFRARLRGRWVSSKTGIHEVTSLYEQFLNEPPPLGP